jgi:hypothetical protein
MPQIGELSPGLWVATAFGGHGLNTSAMAGELIARAIAEGDDHWRLFATYDLVQTGGRFGRAAAQAVFWCMRASDAVEERLAWRRAIRPPSPGGAGGTRVGCEAERLAREEAERAAAAEAERLAAEQAAEAERLAAIAAAERAAAEAARATEEAARTAEEAARAGASCRGKPPRQKLRARRTPLQRSRRGTASDRRSRRRGARREDEERQARAEREAAAREASAEAARLAMEEAAREAAEHAAHIAAEAAAERVEREAAALKAEAERPMADGSERLLPPRQRWHRMAMRATVDPSVPVGDERQRRQRHCCGRDGATAVRRGGGGQAIARAWGG